MGTFVDAATTTVESFVPDLRDAITSMTDWSVIEDSTGGAATFTSGDYVELGTAGQTSVSIRLTEDTNNNKFKIGTRWGDEANSSAGSYGYSTRYANPSNGNHASGLSDGSVTYGLADALVYWLYYENGKGFMTFFRRNQGDGGDQAAGFGYAKVQKLWNYTNASATEGEYAAIYVGNGSWVSRGGLPSGESSNNQWAEGRVNGDSNFSNVPLTRESVLYSVQYSETPVGTIALVLDDPQGTLAHGDVVQDSGGTDIYKMMDPVGMFPNPIGIRMD